MAKIKQIRESVESNSLRASERFKDNPLKSLEFPVIDTHGYCTGIFSEFKLIEPTGEKRKNEDGTIWTDKNAQIKFSFTVPTESGNDIPINFWTGTCVDGVKDKEGRYSKLVTWLIAVGAIDEKILHPKFKADEESIMEVIKDLFDQPFRFKIEPKGRINVPIIESFQLVETQE